MSPDLQGLGVEDRETVDNVSAELHVDVLGHVLAFVKSVRCPVGEVWEMKRMLIITSVWFTQEKFPDFIFTIGLILAKRLITWLWPTLYKHFPIVIYYSIVI